MTQVTRRVRMVLACTLALGAAVLACGVALWGCSVAASDSSRPHVAPVTSAAVGSFFGLGAPARLVAGTPLHVALAAPLSSAELHPGDAWRGVIQAPVIVDGDEMIPAGSDVEGVVTGTRPAMIRLEVQRVFAHNREVAVRATAPPVIAGTRRARDLAPGEAPVAMVATANAATGAASVAPNAEAIALREGAVMIFTVSREVAMR